MGDRHIQKMEVARYAPVAIITCNRIEHLRECVESLARCTYADRTELYISVDYPPGEKYVAGWEQVKEYVQNIQGFRKVNFWIQEKNLGPAGNAVFVYGKAFEKHPAIICTEDDNVFAPAYLDYMNQMLVRYEKDPKVFSVAGFSMFKHSNASGIYKNYAFQPWGNGRWKDKWDYLLQMDYRKLYEESAKKTGKVLGLYFNNKWLFCVYVNRLLKEGTEDGQTRLTDAILTLIFYLRGYYSVFPSKSLVKNNGFDGSGINCIEGVVPDIDKVELDEAPCFAYDESRRVPIIRKWYLPIPEWAKRSAKFKNDPLTFLLYRMWGREKYQAWREKKGI